MKNPTQPISKHNQQPLGKDSVYNQPSQTPTPISQNQQQVAPSRVEPPIPRIPPERDNNRKRNIAIIATTVLTIIIYPLIIYIGIKREFPEFPGETGTETSSTTFTQDSPTPSTPGSTPDPRLEGTIAAYEKLAEGAVQKTTISQIPIYETPDRALSDEDIATLQQIFAEIPQEIIAIRPKGIISTTKDTQAGSLKFNPLLVAFASGPYIYVTDQTFEGPKLFNPKGENKLSVEDVRKIIIHEFIHIAQYNDTAKEKLTKFQPLQFSGITQDFMKVVGWVNTSNSDDYPIWKLEDKEAIDNWYAKANPVEDQAESVAFFVSGHTEELDQKRIDWVTTWIGKPVETYNQGIIPNFSEIGIGLKFDEDVFPESTINQYEQAFPFVQTDGWQSKYDDESPNNTVKIVAFYNQVLPERGWQGSFTQSGTSYSGEWSYKEEKKVSFIIKPNGIITNVLMLIGSK